MATRTVINERLVQQQLAAPQFQTPDAVVAWLGAAQAQEYLSAKWALGLRVPGATDASIEQAFTDGALLRTHVLRPTWHFVAPEDIRWMQALTAPRVLAASAYMIRQHGLDELTFQRTNTAIAEALAGGHLLTRKELGAALAAAGVPAEGNRLAYIVMRAELDALICSGPRRGKQFTYALLEERVPPVPALSREEALARLTRRYFTSHGPATLADFAGWSGLTQADARLGLDLAGADLAAIEIDGQPYWHAASSPATGDDPPAALLLPAYDEYTIGYKDHAAILAPEDADTDKMQLYSGVLVWRGRIAGNWKRTLRGGAAIVDITPFRPLNADQEAAFATAAARYGAFLGVEVEQGEGWTRG
jgi:hypothetical protein